MILIKVKINCNLIVQKINRLMLMMIINKIIKIKQYFKYIYEHGKKINSPYTQQMLKSELDHAIR